MDTSPMLRSLGSFQSKPIYVPGVLPLHFAILRVEILDIITVTELQKNVIFDEIEIRWIEVTNESSIGKCLL